MAKIRFTEPTLIALTGQNFEAYTQNMRVKPYKLYLLGKDDVLSFKETNKTSRVYLAIGGGFKLDNWLGSNSTDLNVHIGGYHGRKLENGDEVEMKREYTERHHKLFENLKEKRTTDWGIDGYALSFNYISDVLHIIYTENGRVAKLAAIVMPRTSAMGCACPKRSTPIHCAK